MSLEKTLYYSVSIAREFVNTSVSDNYLSIEAPGNKEIKRNRYVERDRGHVCELFE